MLDDRGPGADEGVERIREYERVGVERVYLQYLDHSDLDMVCLIGAEIVTALV